MKAWVMESFGAPEVMELRDGIPTPEPGQGEVRVQVRAIALARTKDVSTRAGHAPFAARVRLPHILGTEHAGVIDKVGSTEDDALLGARVAVSAVLVCGACIACRRGREEACARFSLVGVDRAGCYAEYVVVPRANVYPIMGELPFEQAAALAANGPVARAQLQAGAVGPGDVVAVMGAAGALGSAAVALAKHRGAVVIGVDRLAGRSHILDHLPLDAAFDGEDPELAEKILEFTDGWGVDCVVDNLGLSGLWENYRPALATLGRIVISGAIGRDPIPMQLLPFYLHSQSLLGVRTGNPGHMRGLWSEVADGFRLPAGAVSTTSWERMRDAHADVEAGRAAGQTVLEVHP